MIVVDLDPSTYYRAFVPRWAYLPLSGAGAAVKGGRLNRPGTHALYLSDSKETADAEYQQGRFPMPPYLMVSYYIRMRRVVDFQGGYNSYDWPPVWNDLYCNWRKAAFLEKIEPASWRCSDDVISAGYAGILYPSATGKGTNLVVFTELLGPDDELRVLDPRKDLPSDASSWGRTTS